jgi:hypothetical protein
MGDHAVRARVRQLDLAVGAASPGWMAVRQVGCAHSRLTDSDIRRVAALLAELGPAMTELAADLDPTRRKPVVAPIDTWIALTNGTPMTWRDIGGGVIEIRIGEFELSAAPDDGDALDRLVYVVCEARQAQRAYLDGRAAVAVRRPAVAPPQDTPEGGHVQSGATGEPPTVAASDWTPHDPGRRGVRRRPAALAGLTDDDTSGIAL